MATWMKRLALVSALAVAAVIGLVLGWAAVILSILGILLFVLFFGGLAWLGTR